MSYQLPADCYNEIIEYLEEDKHTLHSCLLVDRLLCGISVKILWRNIWNFKSYYQKRPLKVTSSILSTLIACLPNESKELLYINKIFISTPTSKPPLFNYAAFCKVLLTHKIIRLVVDFFEAKPSTSPLSIKDRNYLVVNEIIKMFTNQIYSLEKLTCYCSNINFSFTHFPGVRNLSELCCNSNFPSNFFHQLSQVCHNLQSISIEFSNDISNELIELISLQNNLRNLNLIAFDLNWANIIPALTKHSNTITKLHIYSGNDNSPLSFINSFSNLQEIAFTFFDENDYEDFSNLQHANFSKLQILKFPSLCPNPEHVMNFLEHNGQTLKYFYTSESDKALRLSVAKFCPNLRRLFVIFKNDELDVLKTILCSCQNLEGIKIQCGKRFLSQKQVLETIVNHSPNNFCELKIYNIGKKSDLSQEDLESFLINWNNRTPKKLLKLIIIKNEGHHNDFDDYEENMKIINKYESFGTIKFMTKRSYEEEKDEEEDYYFYYHY
ncbi:unnamed protein product [Rhizophagus irregularis]|nr:unnamed protein product [Rhizophagus irregularis]CAB5298781.1 unnamed protein product [Rhizophagus irregularis]